MSLFLIPIAVMFMTQAIKLLIEGWRGQFNWQDVNNYGGMPSAHSAPLASLIYMLVYDNGDLSGPAIAVAIVLLVVIVRDAVGFRRQLGLHAAILNRLIKDLPDDKEYKYPVLTERLGHTVPEVIVGLLVGLVLSYLAELLFL